MDFMPLCGNNNAYTIWPGTDIAGYPDNEHMSESDGIESRENYRV